MCNLKKAMRAVERKRKREEREKKNAEKEAMKRMRLEEKAHKVTKRQLASIPDCFCPQCLLPEDTSSEVQWIQCDGCELWYHSECCGYIGWTVEELQYETFICGICEAELRV